APLGDFLRFVCHDAALTPLPQSPKKLLTTPLLSLTGKLRLLGDLFRKPAEDGLTIAQWAEYRFGSEILPLVDAAVTGTFAGDFSRLNIDAVMPGVRNLEKEFGSVLKGLKKRKKKTVSSGPLPAMINFPHGMESLIQELSRKAEISFDSGVAHLALQDGKWEITTSGGDQYQARTVIIALPVNRALKMLAPLLPPPVASIPVAHIINLVMAFPGTAEVPRGFGYLAPEKENRFTLGAMFTSHMFPDRIPPGTVLLEALVGGRRHPERLELDDKTIIENVLGDLKSLMKLPDPPHYVKVLRPENGIPQMEGDHPALLGWRKELLQKYSKLHVFGFGWDGIGMNDMIKTARRVAETIGTGDVAGEQQPQVKPVYF
ncbi:MAG: protoporphyrinogen oxidase, partial [Proteobacteria bacterium]|nr:protoporphyrinogen oxidase [Pseudomonadota bacterium]